MNAVADYRSPAARTPTRTFAALVCLVLSLASCSGGAPAPADLTESRLLDQVRAWVAEGRLPRENGSVYTVDVAQLLIYAAQARDRDLYTKLRDWAVAHVLIDKEDDPYTRGFVAWRFTPGQPLDASGTTEALRLAQGLWLGAAAFELPGDRDRALLILEGYARHAGVDQDIWLIRNYFNLKTRGFATNSFMVDYDPDFVAEVADATGRKDLRELADKSYDLVRKAATPSGLIYDMVQPEVMTLYPDAKLITFSPNDIVQLSNACTVAERTARGDPGVARRVLAFAVKRQADGQLGPYYLGRTGEPPPEQHAYEPGAETYAGLVRLAAAVGDRKALEAFAPHFRAKAAAFADSPREPRLYTASESLLALRALAK